MFREHGMDHKMINKNEIHKIIKAVNDSLLTRYDTDELNLMGFQIFLLQVSVFLHVKARFKEPHETGGKKINQLTFGDMFDNLIRWFTISIKSRG